MHVYNLVAYDYEHEANKYLTHERYFTEEQFHRMVADAMVTASLLLQYQDHGEYHYASPENCLGPAVELLCRNHGFKELHFTAQATFSNTSNMCQAHNRDPLDQMITDGLVAHGRMPR